MININVPDLPYEELKGIKVCHLGYRSSAAEVIKQEDPRGEHIYWIGPSGLPEYDGEGTDFHAVKKWLCCYYANSSGSYGSSVNCCFTRLAGK